MTMFEFELSFFIVTVTYQRFNVWILNQLLMENNCKGSTAALVETIYTPTWGEILHR